MNRRSTVVTSRCRICAKTSLGVTHRSPFVSSARNGRNESCLAPFAHWHAGRLWPIIPVFVAVHDRSHATKTLIAVLLVPIPMRTVGWIWNLASGICILELWERSISQPIRGSSECLRFVLLEHVWNGVHWDFMLEYGEVLRTWAIDAPVVAGQDLPARCSATIGGFTWSMKERSRGIAGTSGGWTQVPIGPLVWSSDRVRVELAGSQLVGEVELCSHPGPSRAEQLRGSFRMGNFD